MMSMEQDKQDLKPLMVRDTPQINLADTEVQVKDVESASAPAFGSRPSTRDIWAGWQKGIAIASTWTFATLIVNISIYIWARSKPLSTQGTYILYKADNDATKIAEIWIHLVINILSTMTLAGSNYTLQVLQSPTRRDTEMAHRQHKSLCIGASSFKNWRYMGWKKQAVYVFLIALMLPLHLLYNSITFSTIATFDTSTSTTMVTKDFQEIVPVNATHRDLWQSSGTGTWITMDPKTCRSSIQEYEIMYKWSNIIFFTNITASQQNSSYYYIYNKAEKLDDNKNDCGSIYVTEEDGSPFLEPNTWLQSRVLNYHTTSAFWGVFCMPVRERNQTGHVVGSIPARIDSCLMQEHNQSTIELIPALLLIVIVCNLLKFIIQLTVLFLEMQPMVTIGDAISSYLDSPDLITKDFVPLAVDVFRGGRRTIQRPWKPQKRRFYHGVARIRWIWTLVLCIIFWLVISLSTIAVIAVNGIQGWNVRPDAHYPFGLTDSLAATILLANVPQVALSAIYVYYNALFTYMLIGVEFTSYATHRKGLRVSKPTGEQRSTYFLSLPWKYSVPLIIGSTLLHWLLSQGFYFIQIVSYYADGTPTRHGYTNLIGMICAPLPMLIETIGFALMVVVVILFSLRRYGSAIPFVGTNSTAISAACQTQHSSARLATRKIQYGVIGELASGRQHVGFSDKEVTPLIPGQFYE